MIDATSASVDWFGDETFFLELAASFVVGEMFMNGSLGMNLGEGLNT